MKTLESFVVECFQNVACNNLPGDDFTKYSSDLFDFQQFNKIYYVEPVKDILQVIFIVIVLLTLREMRFKLKYNYLIIIIQI